MFQKESLDELVLCLVVGAITVAVTNPSNDKMLALSGTMVTAAVAVYRGASVKD